MTIENYLRGPEHLFLSCKQITMWEMFCMFFCSLVRITNKNVYFLKYIKTSIFLFFSNYPEAPEKYNSLLVLVVIAMEKECSKYLKK